jgi:hypothetical protein
MMSPANNPVSNTPPFSDDLIEQNNTAAKTANAQFIKKIFFFSFIFY